MEEWRPPTDEESKDEKTLPKKRGTADFFSSLMERLEALRRGREARKNTEEEDDDEESEPGTKKFSKIGRFLRRVMAKPDPTGNEPASGNETPVSPEQPLPDSAVAPTGELRIDHSNESDQSDPQSLPDVVGFEANQNLDSEAGVPDELTDSTERVSDGSEIAPENVGSSESFNSPVPESPSVPERPEFRPILMTQPRTEQVLFDRNTAERAQPERVIERRDPNLLPLIALEYIGRRRADKRIKKEVAGLQKQVERGQKAQNKLQHIQGTEPNWNPSVIERSQDPAKQKINIVPLTRQEQIVTNSRIEIPEHRTSSERVAERVEQSVIEKTTERRVAADTKIFAEQKIRPEAILERVVKAAEHNEAVEKAYELRQEVRDEPGVGITSGGGAQSIGAVMAANMAGSSLVQSQHQETIKRLAQAADQRKAMQPELYRQAATAGIVGAVVIIVFGILAMGILR